MRQWSVSILAVALAMGAGGARAAGCGAAEMPCKVAGGVYHAALPDEPEGAPVVIWLHGYGRSGASVVRNVPQMAAFTGRGYAVVAPTGQPDVNAPRNLDWGVRDGSDWPRDDAAFVAAVKADAVSRFGLDSDRLLVAGFSRGGSMVWDIACRMPELATAFAAVSGAFWEPMAEDCARPVHLHHTHGFSDRLVPLEGRRVTFHGHQFEQGDVMKAVQVWRRVNDCPDSADGNATEGPTWVKSWTKCGAGSITLTLARGGHGVPKGWVTGILEWFEALGGG